MLAYRAKNRLTLDECLRHKWVVNHATFNVSELRAAIKAKHKQTRSLRRKDKRKMQKLEQSVKQRKERKKRIISQCPIKNTPKEFQRQLPSVDNFVPNLLTFYIRKESLNEAYDAAVNVFRVAFEGKSQTNFMSGNP